MTRPVGVPGIVGLDGFGRVGTDVAAERVEEVFEVVAALTLRSVMAGFDLEPRHP
jgi:hypothetical protein